MHVAAQAAVEQLAHAADLAREVDRLGLQRLAPREGEQLARQPGAALRRPGACRR